MQSKFLDNQYNIIAFLCALIVPLMITGPFLPDLLLSSLSLWFIYFCIKKKIFYIYQNIYFYLFILFCIICVISSILSENLYLSFQSSLFYFRIGIFACLIRFLIEKKTNIHKYFYYIFIVTFSILAIDGYFQFFNKVNFIGMPLQYVGSTPRVSSLFGDETILDSYLARLFPLFFALFCIEKNKTKKEIFFVMFLFVTIDILIFLGGSRTSFLFLNISSLFIILFINKYKFYRFISFLLSFLVIIFITNYDDRLKTRYIDGPIESMGLNQKDNSLIIFTPAHDSSIKTAFNMFKDNPYVGVGPKLFRVKCSEIKYATGVMPCNTHPHNFYAQLLAETGLLGFFMLFGLFIYIMWITLKHAINMFFNKKYVISDYNICLLAGILITVWPFSPNGSFFNNHLMIFYSLTFGFFYNEKV
jgi:O-antigen ligase